MELVGTGDEGSRERAFSLDLSYGKKLGFGESVMTSIWSAQRWDEKLGLRGGRELGGKAVVDDSDPEGWRSRFQQDYDRLLFSTPVRRLSDKTQVWPMDENDGVRNRLTHSHEVANLARSIGSRIAKSHPAVFEDVSLHDTIQPILSAIGLAHDLGNPPFGHQGEAAIGAWFRARQSWIFTNLDAPARNGEGSKGLPIAVPERLHGEFLNFDGNPQTIRLVTRLQTSVANVGLNLTAATLSALLKYPIGSPSMTPDQRVWKKFGYFESERPIVEWVREATGLAEGQRHPLTWIMEACDDIAYSVLDVDDVMKKSIVSPDDTLAVLKAHQTLKDAEITSRIQASFEKAHDPDRRPEVVRDIKIGYLRAHLIEALIKEASATFVANATTIMDLSHEKPLMDGSELCETLKGVAQQYAFSNLRVLRTEAVGAAAIDGLMSFFWDAIRGRKDEAKLTSKRTGARAKYGYALISPNYIEDAVRNVDAYGLEGGLRYRELRLLTDMMSGMTDTFAIKLWDDVRQVPHVGRD